MHMTTSLKLLLYNKHFPSDKKHGITKTHYLKAESTSWKILKSKTSFIYFHKNATKKCQRWQNYFLTLKQGAGPAG